MNTPSTNKCCKDCFRTRIGEVYCLNENCPCHKAPMSVCLAQVMVGAYPSTRGLPRPCKDHEPSEVRIKPGEGKIIDGDSFTLTQDGDDLIATPQQEKASWEERLKCVGCCQGDYCAGKAGEHDEELKSFLRTEIAKAEKRGRMENMRQFVPPMVDENEASEKFPLEYRKMWAAGWNECRDSIFAALKNPTHE